VAEVVRGAASAGRAAFRNLVRGAERGGDGSNKHLMDLPLAKRLAKHLGPPKSAAARTSCWSVSVKAPSRPGRPAAIEQLQDDVNAWRNRHGAPVASPVFLKWLQFEHGPAPPGRAGHRARLLHADRRRRHRMRKRHQRSLSFLPWASYTWQVSRARARYRMPYEPDAVLGARRHERKRKRLPMASGGARDR